MKFGLNLRDFLSNPQQPMYSQMQEAVEVFRKASSLGFWAAYMAQHWISHPTIWLQPFPVLARLAPENLHLKLITGVILLPLHNPVDMAEQVVTIDHITNGRFILGVGLGYREQELEVFGATRKERVGRFEESIGLMKCLWSGEETTFEGQYWKVGDARLGLTPIQRPHPSIWIACQSHGAARRAALLGDGCLIGPRVSWEEFRHLVGTYQQTIETATSSTGFLAAHRCIAMAETKETAIEEAQEAAEASAVMYGTWRMQESTMADLGLSSTRDLSEWAIVGNPRECMEVIMRCQEEMGVEYIGLTLLNLPRESSQRGEYLQYISEELLRHCL